MPNTKPRTKLSLDRPLPSEEEFEQKIEDKAPQEIDLSLVVTDFTFTPNGKPLRYHYDQERITAWADEDLAKNGIRTPIWVRPHPFIENHLQLVAGLRRTFGARHLKFKFIPAKIFLWNDIEAYQAAISENKNREDLSRLEEMEQTLAMLVLSLSKFDVTENNVMKVLVRIDNINKGKIKGGTEKDAEIGGVVKSVLNTYGQQSLSYFVRSHSLIRDIHPDILTAVRDDRITFSAAEQIHRAKGSENRDALLVSAMDGGLSVSEIKKAVGRMSREARAEKLADTPETITQLSSLTKKIAQGGEISPRAVTIIDKFLQEMDEFLQMKMSM